MLLMNLSPEIDLNTILPNYVNILNLDSSFEQNSKFKHDKL